MSNVRERKTIPTNFYEKNIKTFFQIYVPNKLIFQIGLKKFLWLKKLKILFRGHMFLVILNAKKLLGRFTRTAKNKSNRV